MTGPAQQTEAEKAAAEKAAAEKAAAEKAEAEQSRPRFRAGQTVAFRVPETLTGLENAGHALILRLLGEVAHLAVIGGGYLQAHVDQLAPASVADVPNPLPAPTEPAEGSGS